jgi:hypothetical protein
VAEEPYESDRNTYPAQARAAMLARLPSRLASRITEANAVAQDEVTATLPRAFPFDGHGVGKDGLTPDGYWFKLAGMRRTMAAWSASRILDGDERPAILIAKQFFSEPRSTTPAASRLAHVGFRLPWSLAIDAVRALVSDATHELAAMSDDGAYGFVLDSYIGYLPYELSDEETVYRVARWRPFG